MGKEAVLTIDATITERGQTTVPAPIRRMLGVQKGGITFKGLSDGTVIIEPKAVEDHVDPAVGAFLTLIERDIASGNVAPPDSALISRIDALVAGVDVDLDTPLEDD